MILVDGVQVPIVWSPSDLRGGDSDGHAGRGRQVIRALVFHRIVGTLETTVNQTFYPTTDDLLTKGERRVSSQFSLGHWGSTGLRVVQHVALENTAYCNGQSVRDRAACTWRTWINAGRPDPNEITVSFEHEDNAAAGDYVVTEDIVRLSIELARLLLSGDGKAIRAAGIRCSDAAAAQLGRIKPSAETLVPHRTVAPVTKPYCWMPYRADQGFPQARYVAALTAPVPAPTEDAMPGLKFTLDATKGLDPLVAFATAVVKDTGASAIRGSDIGLVGLPQGTPLGTVQRGTLDPPLEAQRGQPLVAGDRTSIVAFSMSGETFVMLASNVTPTALTDPTPFTAADVKSKAGAALELARTKSIAAIGQVIDDVAATL